MQDKDLALALLSSETETAALAELKLKGVLEDASRWKALGNMPNNQSVVHAQQSTASAALVEKFTNGLDAILMRRCKAAGLDPRGRDAPDSMQAAVQEYFGDLAKKSRDEIRALAEDNLLLYATGTKSQPSVSIYDSGEGQLSEDFPSTFCSLVYSNDEGSYKGAVPFVQGRFNMGGTGVLPFCGDERKMQLIVSRRPVDVAGTDTHEWAFTIFCFFPSKTSPEWRYLVGPDGSVMTAGSEPLALIPKAGAKSGELCNPRERFVASGTLVKMFNYKAPRSNVCGELFKKLEEYLLRPMMPLRVYECRGDYKANVMGVTVFNRLSAWGKDKLEPGFEEGAGFSIILENGEVIPGEIRVFKVQPNAADEDHPQTGVRALINGQSHAKRDAQFFRTQKVDKEHIAGSMLVTLDCTNLSQESRNALFMSNRETFRDDNLLKELFKKLQRELYGHEGLTAINMKRYEDKVANAVSDEDGLSALEEMLAEDPELANLFGSMNPGKVAAKTVSLLGGQIVDEPTPFEGLEFPTFFKRANGETALQVDLPRGDDTRVSFITDVKNNYFNRPDGKGECIFQGQIQPTFHLFNGRLTFTFHVDKSVPEGTSYITHAEIADTAGHGPFKLVISATVTPPREKAAREPPGEKKVENVESRPNVIEVQNGPDDPAIEVQRPPKSKVLQIVINTGSRLLAEAKAMRPKEEEAAVQFVFKYGLALIAMSLIEAAKKTPAWDTDEAKCRSAIEEHAAGVGRVIVPLCLTLPKKLPKAA